jgi:cell division septum initiation protein DivIVA
VNDVQELVPLRTDFDVVLRGYRRGQVRQYVRAVEEELRLAAADRDANAELAQALATEVEQLRAQNARLSRQLDELSRTPVEPAAVPPRLRRMVELAKEEAAEITARAQAAAEHSWATAEEAAGRLRARYADALAEMDRTRRETEIEHRTLLQQARADATVMTTDADRRRGELDAQAAQRRQRIESDFEIAMARRRSEAMREVAEQKVAAQTEAERLVREATEEAEQRVTAAAAEATRRIAAAEREVGRLGELRGRMAAQLRGAREVLVGAGPLLQPLPAEKEAAIPGPRGPRLSR